MPQDAVVQVCWRMNPQWRQVSPVQIPLCPVTLRNLPLAPLPCLCMRNVLPVMLIPILLKSKREWVYSMRPQLYETSDRCLNCHSLPKLSELHEELME